VLAEHRGTATYYRINDACSRGNPVRARWPRPGAVLARAREAARAAAAADERRARFRLIVTPVIVHDPRLAISVTCRQCCKPLLVVKGSVPDRERLCNACARPL
jgi:hypothetical protein